MSTSKLTSIVLSAFFATAWLGMTACDKSGSNSPGSKKGKSDRLRWVAKPVSGTSENDGKIIRIPGIAVDFYRPDTLYVYKECAEAVHTPEGPDKAWIPLIRCTSPFAGEAEQDDFDDDDDDSSSSDAATLTIFVTERADMIINERATASLTNKYEQEGYKVESINYFDEYMSKAGRRGIEILVQTINTSNGYPDREIRRFIFPKDDVVFIAHIDYPYGDDRSGINRDWERILWSFQYAEDGPLYQ